MSENKKKKKRNKKDYFFQYICNIKWKRQTKQEKIQFSNFNNFVFCIIKKLGNKKKIIFIYIYTAKHHLFVKIIFFKKKNRIIIIIKKEKLRTYFFKEKYIEMEIKFLIREEKIFLLTNDKRTNNKYVK